MANLLIGGTPVTSFYSDIAFAPYSATLTPLSPTNLSQTSNSLVFDQVHATFKRIRYLDNATHTGLWCHTGVRETATSFTLDAHILWDLNYPMDWYDTLLANKLGFQMIWTISQQGVIGDLYPSNITSTEYYWCPSVFLNVQDTHVDVSTKPPRLINCDLHIEANSPAFFMPTDSSAVGATGQAGTFIQWINSRGWSF